MDAATLVALLGGGSVLGVVVDRLLSALLGRRQRDVTLADLSTQIAERQLNRMEQQLAGAERHVATANITIAELRAEVAQLRAEIAAQTVVVAERDKFAAENKALKTRIEELSGGFSE